MSSSIVQNQEASKQVSALLAKCLATSYVLYTKTQNFHWNVVGARFHSLHEMFQEQYEELSEALDEIAERIRMIGSKSPGTMKEFLNISAIKEAEGTLSEDQMLQELFQDHESLIEHLNEWIKEAVELGDEGTADLFIQRIRAHQKMAWMIRSHFSE
ncbi:MAG: DNA starvation/stationary phase protection protein [Chlamydiales bacterium]|nr:DNA starvation/stationary phase protection protein [Chlamydiia bacterium]MCP5508214.1 DNA starvation/stationary phase protection protein [Chlamydiales bacterium]